MDSRLVNGKHINTIYADFEKAFDKVPHYLLLKQEALLSQRGSAMLRVCIASIH